MALTISLNGNNYVSEKTRQAFETALEDSVRVNAHGNGNGNGNRNGNGHNDHNEHVQVAQPVTPSMIAAPPPDNTHVLESVERGLARAFDHQQQTLHAHERYLDCQADYAKIFAQVMEQQGTIFTAGSATPQQATTAAQVLESLARSVARFHDIQADTLNVHKQFLDQQGEYTRATVELLQHSVLSTGNGNGNGHHPTILPDADAQPIAAIVAQPAPSPDPEPPVVVAAPAAPPTLVASPTPGDGGGEQAAELSPRLPSTVYRLPASLLDIVSEKTGYPAEMLDLTMDMEADLGIDSIKRVEILGALQDLHPDLPEFSADALAELRTLGQIVEYMGAQSVPESPTTEDGDGEQTPASPPTRLPSTVYRLPTSLLDIVSEKTGYPAEMLDLTMDMEADLGIDSIKRVEILGALQDLHPDLPEFSADALAELRTLGQIVDYMAAQTGTDRKKAIATNSLVRDHNPAPPPALQRLEVRLRPLPPPDRLEDAPSPEGVWIVSDDGEGASMALAQALTARGVRVALLRFPAPVIPEQQPLPESVEEIVLESLSEAHLETQLATVGPVAGFIHVEPRAGWARAETGASNEDNGASDAKFFTAETKARLKHVFLIAKHLKNALHAGAHEGRASFVTVTRMDGALGLGGTDDFNAVAGGFAGLTKTLSLEWPTTLCRTVDITPQFDATQTAQAILAELEDPNRRLIEVGHGPHGRVTLEARSKRQEAGSKKESDPASCILHPASCILHPASCTLVSGGGRGITAQCVIKLAERYGGTYVLLGRSSIEGTEPVWAAGVDDEAILKQRAIEAAMARGECPTPVQVQREIDRIRSKREIESTLRAVEQAGGHAEYISVDVTDGAALSAAVKDVTNRLEVRITGILHGAGVLADKRIEHKTGNDFERVYGTKVTGLQNLLACVPADQLKYLILFSSVAGFYGNVGQADYALANEILNKTAHLVAQRNPACRAIAIDWSPWDGGMVTPELKRLFAERDIDVIPIEAGTALLADELAAGASHTPQIVVGTPLVAPASEPEGALRTHYLRRTLSLDANPFLRDHVIGGQAVLPTVCAVAWMVNACEQLYPGYTFFSADEYKAFKGIVFNETLADAYTLELNETAKTREELVFEGLIRSQTPEGKPRYHYKTRITLLRQLPEAPVFTAFDLDETEAIPGDPLYAEKVLFHGPSFRGVERVFNIGPHGLTLRCLLPEIRRETQGQFPVQTFNPYLTDVQLQSLLIWAARFKQSPGLPLRIQRGEQFRPAQFGEPVYATMTVQSSNDASLVADVTVHNAQGLVYSRVTGAEITLSPRLNQLFQQNQLRLDETTNH